METKEWTFPEEMDRSDWPPGPWDNEPDKKQWQDRETGLPCLIVRNSWGALCGYVGVPKSHPDHGKDWEAINVSVHGGVTFTGSCRPSTRGDPEYAICHTVPKDEDDNVWWIGFDCSHYGDAYPNPRIKTGGTYRDIECVEGNCARLAIQLLERSKDGGK